MMAVDVNTRVIVTASTGAVEANINNGLTILQIL